MDGMYITLFSAFNQNSIRGSREIFQLGFPSQQQHKVHRSMNCPMYQQQQNHAKDFGRTSDEIFLKADVLLRKTCDKISEDVQDTIGNEK